MEINDLAASFRVKTDDELLRLATELDHLTPEGEAALHGELSRRRLEVPSRQESTNEHPESVEPASARERTVARALGVSEFITGVVSTYQKQSWFFIRLITPAVVITYVITKFVNNVIRQLSPHTYWRDLPQARLIEVTLTSCFIRLGQYVVSWLMFCFAFAAICSAVGQSQRGGTPSIGDSFTEFRGRTGLFLRLSLLLFVLFLGIQIVWIGAVMSSSALAYTHHFRMTRLENLLLTYALWYLGILVFSRFGLAIPAFLREGCSVGSAMFRSDELTEGQWLKLAVLLGKTAIGGYVAGMLPFWLAAWFLTGARVPWWFENALMVLSIAGVSAIEPMLFIGFTLLYENQSALIPSEAPPDPLVLSSAAVSP